MIDLTFQIYLLHHEDEEIMRVFSSEADLPGLPANVTDTEFKMVPGVANILANVIITWNHSKRRFIISGHMQPDTLAGFELVVATLIREGWKEEKVETEAVV